MRWLYVTLALIALFLGTFLLFGEPLEALFAGDRGVQTLQAYGRWAWLVAIGHDMTIDRTRRGIQIRGRMGAPFRRHTALSGRWSRVWAGFEVGWRSAEIR